MSQQTQIANTLLDQIRKAIRRYLIDHPDRDQQIVAEYILDNFDLSDYWNTDDPNQRDQARQHILHLVATIYA